MKLRSRRSVIGTFAVAGAAVTLGACGTTTDGGGDSQGERGADAGPFKIATVPKVEGISWFQAMANGVDQFNADNDDVDAWQIGPDTEDAAKQVQIIEDLIAQGVDAIVVVPNDPQALIPSLTKARDGGIIVISHEAPALAGTDAVDYDVEAFDNVVFGEKMFEKLAEGMEGSGQFVGMVGSLTSETHMAWYNAGVAYLEANHPDITAVTEQPYEDNNDNAAARSNALEILSAYPDLKGFVNGSVSAGASMATVLKEKNNKDVTMSSLSLPSVAGPYLEEGWMYSAQTWDPAAVGYASNVVALMMLKGESIEGGIDLQQEGYDAVTVEDQLIVGDAIMMLEKGQFPDGDYPF
ncbi:MAG: substrate-binding domain-containing protein [Brachybacterium sp.]|uniref:substrate-binding domain-containing protein n=1 Tax=Brachybacterium sp. TaxID=1891286 RepID=UPI003F926ECA